MSGIPLGEWVFAPWGRDEFLYPGIVVEHLSSETIRIAYLDGDQADVPIASLHSLQLPPGARVSVNYKGKGQYFSGAILRQVGFAFDIQYDDGERGWTTLGQCRIPKNPGAVGKSGY